MRSLLRTRLAACTVAAHITAAAAHAQTTPVYPGDPAWQAVNQAGATASITGAMPRSGNGSLELQLTGDPFGWGFYRTAGDPLTARLGLLADLIDLRFDWLRTPLGVAGGDAPWLAQTPVLRLLVREDGATGGPRFSELVWERWYNDASPAPLGSWQQESLLGQNLWRVTLDAANARSYTRAGCAEGAIDPLFPLLVLPATAWTGSSGCYGATDAVVWGLAVGVGSNWTGPYLAFADNVVVDFAATRQTDLAVNFELAPNVAAVPEPATVGLTALGLIAMLGAAARRRRRGGGTRD